MLYVRRNGPAHLRQMAMQEIQNMLTSFISENFWYLANETTFAQVSGSFSACVSEPTKERLAQVLAESRIFNPEIAHFGSSNPPRSSRSGWAFIRPMSLCRTSFRHLTTGAVRKKWHPGSA